MVTQADGSLLQSQSLIHALDRHAQSAPDKVLFALVNDGTEISSEITAAELRKQALLVANQIVSLGASPGDRVILMYPTGTELIVALLGCMYARVSAVPVYPARRDLSVLEGIIDNCEPHFGLVDDGIYGRLISRFVGSSALERIPWHKHSVLVSPLELDCIESPTDSLDVPALLQYTSGSTGSPKGVVLTHENLASNLRQIRDRFCLTSESRVVSWLPLYHDMGLIGVVFSAIYNGLTSYLMKPEQFLQKPIRWLQAISTFRGTVSGGPNFAYQLCYDRIEPAQLKSLELSSWCTAFNGAEPVRSAVLERFADKFASCGYEYSAAMPCYGMAEASLLVANVRQDDIPRVKYLDKEAFARHKLKAVARSQPGSISVVSNGSVIDEHLCAIVDPKECTRCPPDRIGEIWVSGASASSDYWGAPQSSEENLRAKISGSDEAVWLRTGDLGFLDNGELYVTGRHKDVLILRGRNYYPNDVEQLANSSDELLQADGTAAFQIDTGKSAQMVVVQELTRAGVRSGDAQALTKSICNAISAGLQIEPDTVVLVGPRQIPRTSSGKIRRTQTRSVYELGGLKALAEIHPSENRQRQKLTVDLANTFSQLSPIERGLLEQVADVLEISGVDLTVDTPLIDLGMDSLLQLNLAHRLEEHYDLSVTAEQFFDGLSIAGIARLLKDRQSSKSPMRVEGSAESRAIENGPSFSIMYFSSDSVVESSDSSERPISPYSFMQKSAAFADAHGFEAVWLPERHFHRFGGLFPNPATLAAALAVSTHNIRIRAGSVILPLHEPIRVAEEWSVVDNLSHGRIDLAFGQGWNPNDYVLRPEKYAERLQHTFDGIDEVDRLWEGKSVQRTNGVGAQVGISSFPSPVQPKLNKWMTCSGDVERFRMAGKCGMNVLTALLFQDVSELELKLNAYYDARAEAGHEPSAGRVTLMLHTFLGEDLVEVRSTVRLPLTDYLRDSVDLWKQKSTDLDSLSDSDRERVLEFAFERYFRNQSLCGTPQSCIERVRHFHSIGVTEIATLLDFGVASEKVLAALPHLNDLRSLANQEVASEVTAG